MEPLIFGLVALGVITACAMFVVIPKVVKRPYDYWVILGIGALLFYGPIQIGALFLHGEEGTWNLLAIMIMCFYFSLGYVIGYVCWLIMRLSGVIKN